MQSLRPLLLPLALHLFACNVPVEVPAEQPDAGLAEPCANPCGELCCADGEQCDPVSATCAPPCEPRCEGRVCGPDSCGGSCGECPESHACDEVGGRCECRPDCRGRICGDDGCGGSCGACGPAEACSEGACVSCVRDCSGRACGFDGCGGLCGACAAGQVCSEENGACTACTGDASCAGNAAGERCSAGRCVECSDDSQCSLGRCDVSLGRCVECGSDGHCAQTPGRPYCRELRCTQCRTDADCSGATPECGPAGACRIRGGSDTCDAPEPLVFAGTVARVAGTTADAQDDGRGVCGGGAADRIYLLELTAETYLDVTVAPRDPGFQPVVYVRKEQCEDFHGYDDLGCGAAASPGVATRIELSAIPPGTYWVWVDGFAGTAGAYDLEVKKRAPPPVPANDTCAGVIPLTFTNGRAHVLGDSRTAVADVQGSCTSSGPDVVYRFTTTAEHGVSARVFRDFSTPGFEPSLHLRNECASGAATSEHGCNYNADGLATLRVSRLAPGTYYLWVDGKTAAGGRFTLDVELLPPGPSPLNEGCAAAESLTFDSTGKATASVSLEHAEDDDDGSCGGAYGDVVYRITTVAERRLTASVSNVPAGTAPRLYLRGECGVSQRELACDPQELEVNVLPAGTWYLWVDSASSKAAGSFDVTVQLDAPRHPPPHDVCGGAAPLPILNDVGRVSGSTKLATASTTGTCGGDSADVVYTFTTSAERDVVATVTPSPGSAGFEPVVFIRSACASSAASSQFGCGLFSGGKAVAQSAKLPAGTWFVWVGGEGSKGDFELEVKLTEPPVAGNVDFCPGVPLTFVNDRAVVTGTTTGATGNTSAWDCGGNGPDHVYAVTLASRSALTVRMDTTSTTFEPIVHLRRACTSELLSDEVACDYSASLGEPAMFHVPDLAPGTYYLWVDGVTGTDGDYRVEVLRGPVVANPPAGDQCPGAALTLVNGTVTVEENSALADDWVDSTCNGAGRDTAFTFSIPAQQSVKATVRAVDPLFRPVVFLRAACADYSSEFVCSYTSAWGGTAEAFAPRLPAGTYTAWVDTFDDYGGRFQLEVTAAAPVPRPANDDCSGPVEILANSTVQGTTVDADPDYGTGSFSSSTCSVWYEPLGADLVYRFQATADGPVKVTLQPGADFDTGLWVTTGTCGGESACVAYQDDNYAGEAESVTFTATAGTDYFILVDSWSNERGTFTLSVE